MGHPARLAEDSGVRPGTKQMFTHLMPSSDARARKAVDSLYEGTDPLPDGPEAAQGR
ncbi:hypothetical protein ACFCYB_30745 [Streptomyces sp. NPDC056309]|uniref:hypothetical protein n=1 Tax=unclassified Streptomyces TaxID=2593676 RepID=UPI0035DA6BC8